MRGSLLPQRCKVKSKPRHFGYENWPSQNLIRAIIYFTNHGELRSMLSRRQLQGFVMRRWVPKTYFTGPLVMAVWLSSTSNNLALILLIPGLALSAATIGPPRYDCAAASLSNR